jgi:murein L,D-transpeptidase YafK
MRLYSLIWIAVLCSFRADREVPFKSEQLSYARVKSAYEQKWPVVKAMLKSKDINTEKFQIFIRGFKFEEDLEVWAKDSSGKKFVLIKSYKWCSNVGLLGPKRREGDLQIPEGIYHISKFNPESNFHLSLKLNYPNKSDSILGYAPRLGGMIFIHGGCKSIGCIPITYPLIEELYVFCLQAAHAGQKYIPVHLFPMRMTDENFELLRDQYVDETLLAFWKNIRTAFVLFEKNKIPPSFSVDKSGQYVFSN